MTPPARAGGRHVGGVPLKPLSTALLSTTLATMPVFFLGGLATFVRSDLGFGQAGLGLATAAFFATGAVLSVPGGRLSHRWGDARTTAAAALLSIAALVGIATAAHSLGLLVALLVAAGVANAVAQPAANGLMAAALPAGRLGVAFGIKQSAIPLASLAAGSAVPLLALTLGWRWAFAAAALTGVPLLWLLRGAQAASQPGPTRRAVPSAGGPLLILTLIAGLGAGAANAMGAFYVDSAVVRGVPAATAGLLLSFGAVSGIGGRILSGWVTDRRPHTRAIAVAVQLLLGAGAVAAIAGSSALAVLIPATALAYGAGWGWNGVVLAAVVQAYPEAPAAATGVTQAGVYGGAVLGPLVFGVTADRLGYPVAWLGLSAVLLTAAVAAAALARTSRQRAPRGVATTRHTG